MGRPKAGEQQEPPRELLTSAERALLPWSRQVEPFAVFQFVASQHHTAEASE